MRNAMENERRTDQKTGMGLEETRLSDILSASQIKATDTYETPPQIIWIDNSTIATLGNFSASTGKAKSKKTFNVSALVAASLAGKQVLNYRAHLPEGKTPDPVCRYRAEPLSLSHGAGTYSASGRASYHSRQREP